MSPYSSPAAGAHLCTHVNKREACFRSGIGVPLYVEMPLMRLMPVLPRVRTISLRLGSCCVAGEFDVPLRMFLPRWQLPFLQAEDHCTGESVTFLETTSMSHFIVSILSLPLEHSCDILQFGQAMTSDLGMQPVLCGLTAPPFLHV